MITKMGSEQPDGVWPTHSYDVWHPALKSSLVPSPEKEKENDSWGFDQEAAEG